MLHSLQNTGYQHCHGCGLCALVCPVYQQDGSVMNTPHGWCKSLQAGVRPEEDDVHACILCGACTAICPENIDMLQLLASARHRQENVLSSDTEKPVKSQRRQIVMILDKETAEDELRMNKIIGLEHHGKPALAVDQGRDISSALYNGIPVSKSRLDQFLTTLQSVKKIIINDGLLQALIRDKLPQIPMISVGRLVSSATGFRKGLSAHDCYVMDVQSYHADYERAVGYYDQLQSSSGCVLNRDLHRLGVPVAHHRATERFDSSRPVDWLKRNQAIKRFVVESIHDYEALKRHQDITVSHILELL